MSDILEVVKPSAFDISDYFMDTVWRNYETELIARNIVINAQRNGDRWQPFTWEQYKEQCQHNVTRAEIEFINNLVSNGALKKNGDEYSVTPTFIAALSRFIKAST